MIGKVLVGLAVWTVISAFLALVWAAFCGWQKTVQTPRPGQFDYDATLELDDEAYSEVEAAVYEAAFAEIVRAESQRTHPSRQDPGQ